MSDSGKLGSQSSESSADNQIQIDMASFRERLDDQYPGLKIPTAQDREYETAEAAERKTLTKWLTPIEEHFICHRYTSLDINTSTWTISLTGVGEEVELSMESIVENHPTVSVAHTMECAGNSRVGFEKTEGSVLWGCTAVGNAIWIGTPLSSILTDYDIDSLDEKWLTVIGADAPEGEDTFARSIPMAKVLDDCILAYGMNGETLPKEHGHPIRLIVPGWYGVNNVKWVKRMEIMDMMMFGDKWEDYYTFQQQKYRIYPKSVEEPTRQKTVSTYDTLEQFEADDIEFPYAFDATVKSAIGYPDDDTMLSSSDRTVAVVGVAWAGDDRVENVDISVDGGETWSEAEFIGPALPGSWRLFRYMWYPEPGEYRLVSCAKDEYGRSQPATISDPEEELSEITDEEFPWNPRGYCNNSYMTQAIDVIIQ